MTTSSPRFQTVIAEIDAANANDPRRDMVGGTSRPREVVYSERMSDCLSRIYPNASEELQIAARAQHICRWQFPRDKFPLGREGYNAWRAGCREHHAALTSKIMHRHDYTDKEVAQVVKIIKKEELKQDPESQALENVVGVIFVQHYLDGFIATHKGYDEEKLVNILKKTLRKMNVDGHAAVLKLHLPPQIRQIVKMATV